ncbi:hypothetical protein LTR29_012887 [Friedmanniomyces endolithicus]|nr:hypothetical protein LTR29_012887 [Friedmanniomyces endolithicus]
MQPYPFPREAVSTFLHELREPGLKGIRETHVAYPTPLEKSERSDPLRAVDNLVRDDKVAGFDLLLQATDCAESDDGADTEAAEGGDVGAVGDFVGRELMVQAVAGDEGDGDWFGAGGGGVVEDGDWGGGGAPGGVELEGCDVGEAAYGLEAGAADYCDVDGKYRNKKRAGGNVRYEEVRGEGTEELKMPKQSHSRSGSDAFDVEDTPTMGMGGQTLYQPPSGSPPDDASSSLMPEGSLRASSQGQWNGRRYDRSPSPPRGRNPEGMAGYEVV